MFDHPNFELLSYRDIPLRRDLIMMDVKWLEEYEEEWIKVFDGREGDPYPVGYVCYVAADSVGDDWLEMSWYPNTNDRFHEVPIFLPSSAIRCCVEIPAYDENPHIFVESVWLAELYERPLAAFALVDAAGIKTLLRDGRLTASALRKLRDRIDSIAERHPNFAFISFADSLLVKQVWSVGHVDSEITYTYAPESLLPVVTDLVRAFEEVLEVPAYAILTQGINSYSDDAALHVSRSQNHISLNTLGLPFAQLMEIEDAAKNAVRRGAHAPSQLYVDTTFFRSLRFRFEFDKKSLVRYPFQSPMTQAAGATYVATSIDTIVSNLMPPDDGKQRRASKKLPEI